MDQDFEQTLRDEQEKVIAKSVDKTVEDSEISRMWGVIADESLDAQRRHADVTRRLRLLEAGAQIRTSDDPMHAIGGIVLAIVVLQVGLPLLIDLIAAWRSGAKKAE
jgi:hypothetical protein